MPVTLSRNLGELNFKCDAGPAQNCVARALRMVLLALNAKLQARGKSLQYRCKVVRAHSCAPSAKCESKRGAIRELNGEWQEKILGVWRKTRDGEMTIELT